MRCDILIKKSLSRWSHLPKATSTPYFHSLVKVGGIVVIKLHDTIPVLRDERERHILNVEDSAAHSLAQRLDKSSRDATRGCAASTQSTRVPSSMSLTVGQDPTARPSRGTIHPKYPATGKPQSHASSQDPGQSRLCERCRRPGIFQGISSLALRDTFVWLAMCKPVTSK